MYYISGTTISITLECDPQSETFEVVDYSASGAVSLPVGPFIGDLEIEWYASATGGTAELDLVPVENGSLESKCVAASEELTVREPSANHYDIGYEGVSAMSCEIECSETGGSSPKPKLILLPQPSGGPSTAVATELAAPAS